MFVTDDMKCAIAFMSEDGILPMEDKWFVTGDHPQVH